MHTKQKIVAVNASATAAGNEREIVVVVRHGGSAEIVRFAFSLSGTVVRRDGNDLVLSPKSGREVRLSEFFDIKDWEDLPQLSFADTPPLTMPDLFDRLNITPAEAETSWQGFCPLSANDSGGGCGRYRDVKSGGEGEYRGGSGELIGGVAAFGDLGTDGYGSVRGGRVLLNAEQALHESLWGSKTVVAGAGGAVTGGSGSGGGSASEPGGGNGGSESGGGNNGGNEPGGSRYVYRFSEDELMDSVVPKFGSIASALLPGATYALKDGNGAGTYGFFTLNPDGSWSYARTAVLDFMANGRIYSERFTVVVTLADGRVVERELVVEVQGNNDAPVVDDASASSDDVSFAGNMALSGVLTGTDKDEGDAVRQYAVAPGAASVLFFRNGVAVFRAQSLSDYGELTVNPDGTWVFRAVTQQQKDNVLQLGEGEEIVLSVPIRGTDGSGASGSGVLVITITGSDQAPVFHAETMSVSTSEDALTASGSLSGTIAAHDYEGAALVWTAASIKGVYGTFAVDAAGRWTYTLDMDINFMAGGQTYVEHFPVTVSDGGKETTENFTVIIAGDNDNPVIIGTRYGSTDVFAPDGVVLSGDILAGDVDAGDAPGNYSVAGVITASVNGVPVNLGDYGIFTLASDGSWTLTAETPAQKAALQSLQNGETLDLTVPVRVLDSFGAAGTGTVTIYVNGSNSAPVLRADGLSADIGEDALIAAGSLSGTLSADDADNDALSYSLAGSGTGTYGVLSLDASGRWTYTPLRDINFMAAGQSYADTFTVRVSDGRGGTDERTLTVTVTGDNDAPVVRDVRITATDQAASGGTVFSGAVPAFDPDEGDFARNFTAGAATALRGGVGVSADDYGEFSLDASGNWTFRAATPEQQANMLSLAKGETLTVTVPVTATDGSGATGNGLFTFVVTGTNQAPVFTGGSLEAAAGEDDVAPGMTVSGSLTAVDPDTGDTLTYSVSNGTGLYGNLTVTQDGTWTYTPTGDVGFLPEGQSYTETFTVAVSDGKGGVSEETFTLTISGSNDAPVLSNASATATDSALAAGPGLSGRITGTDPDAGDTVSGYTAGTVSASRNGTVVNYTDYGTLVMNADGIWTFAAVTPEQQRAVLGLGEGETLIITVPVTARDSFGASSNTSTLTITVTGGNQAPAFDAVSLSASINEDAVVTAGLYSGTLTAVDPDSDDTFSFTIKPGTGTGTYGDFTLLPSGAWTYTPKVDLNFMAEGQSYTETFTAVVTDEHGASSERVFTLTITGDNDGPVVQASTAPGNDTAVAGAGISGRLSGTDAEGDPITYSAGTGTAMLNDVPVTASDYGTLTMNPDGTWVFRAVTPEQQENILSLAKDDVLSLAFPVTGTDPHGGSGGSTLTVIVTGTNQAPVFDAATLNAATHEDVIMDAGYYSGTVTAQDPDNSDTVTYAVKAGTETGLYGRFTMDADGSWTYIPTTDLNVLVEGQTYTETFTVVVSDGFGGTSEQVFTLTITGDNDAPVVQASDAPGSDTAVAGAGISGRLSGTDAEGDPITYSAGAGTATLNDVSVSASDYGTLTMNPDGTWTFRAVTPEQQAETLGLAPGDVLTISFPVTGTDPHGAAGNSTLTVTIAGSDQAPIFDAETLSATVHEDVIVTTGSYSGTLAARDPDNGDTLTFALKPGSGTGLYGDFTLLPGGAWTYTPKTDLNFMVEGQSYTETFTAVVTDAHGAASEQVFTLTITGDNDAPVVQASDAPGNDTAIAGAGLSGRLSGTDAEGELITYSAGAGTATLNSVSVTASDYGTLTMNPDGTWTFAAVTPEQQAKVLGLAQGDVLTISFPVTGADPHGAFGESALTVTVTGTSQSPVFDASTLNAATHEDVIVTAGSYSGTLTAVDPDSGDTFIFSIKPGTGSGIYGDFAMDSTGAWTYTPKTDLNFMAEGQTYTEHFTAVVTDEHGMSSEQVFTLTITGDNDAPILQASDAPGNDAAVAGAGISGRLSGTDAEGELITYSAGAGTATLNSVPVTASDYGTLTMNPDGTWTFRAVTPEQQAKALGLAPGDVLTVSFPVTGTDPHGAAGAGTLTVTVTGSDQAPIFDAETLHATVHEDVIVAAGSYSGTLAASDPDNGDTLTFALKPGSGTGLYGDFTLLPNGAWTYTPTLDINQFAEGQSYTERFVAVVTDAHGASSEQVFTLTITGDNDAPVIIGSTGGPSNLDPADGVVIAGEVLAEDIDQGDTVALFSLNGAISAVVGNNTDGYTPATLSEYGVFILNADGTWRLEAQTPEQRANLQALGENDTLVLTVPVSGTDEHGGTGSGSFTVTVNGKNNPPVVDSGTLQASIFEDDLMSAGMLSGSIAATDPDGDTPIFVLGGGLGQYGILTLQTNGAWLYTLNRDINFMVEGQTYTETFHIRVSDGNGGIVEKDLTITITGENDAPVLEAAAASGSDAAVAGVGISGRLSGTDAEGDSITYSAGAGTATLNSVSVSASDYGTLSMNPDGTWTFAAVTPEQQAKTLGLAPGDVLTVSFPVTGTDPHGDSGGSSLTVTVTGTSQAPVFDAATLNAATHEDVIVTAGSYSGTLAAVDPDSGDTFTFSIKPGTGTGAYGDFTLLPNGAWTHTPKTDLNFMVEGQSYTETFTAVVTDAHGAASEQVFTLTITGDNDAPILQPAAAPGNDTAIAGAGLSGRLSGTDAEGEFITYSAGAGTATLNSVSVTASDYGTLSMNPDGTWTFAATTPEQQAKVLGLAQGDVLTVSFPVTGTDPHGAFGESALTVTVTGTSQAPVFDAATLNAATHEDVIVTAGSYSGTLTAVDPDSGDTFTFSIKPGTGTGAYGDFTLLPNGVWTYTPKTDLNFMADGQIYTETFTAVVTDSHGVSSEQVFSLTITGDNDAPILQPAAAPGNDTAVAGAGLSGSISGTDPEGESITYSAGVGSALLNGSPVAASDYGTLTMNPDGTWTFAAVTPEQQAKAFGLAPGDVLTVSFPVTGTDPHGAFGESALTVTVTGTGQSPVFDASTLNAATHEDVIVTAGSYSGTLAASDPDSGDTFTFSIKPGTGTGIYGDFTIDSTGAWTYTPKTDLNFMAEGQTYTEHFTAVVTDNHGVSSEQVFTLTITGDNDAPVVADVSAPVTDAYLSAGEVLSGSIVGNDPEGDAVVYSAGPVAAALNGNPADVAVYGELVVGADGQWTFAARTEAQRNALAALKPGDSLVLTVPITGSDPYNAEDTGALTITISGTNQGPTVEDALFSTTDAVAAQVAGVSGTLSGSDPESDAIRYSLGTASAVRGGASVNVGDYGALSVDPDTGVWIFKPVTQAQADNLLGLKQGEVLTITVPVTGSDPGNAEGGAVLVITVTGTNEAPVFDTGTLSAAVNEDVIAGQGYYSGKLEATDADSGAALSYHLKAGTGTGVYGSFTVQADGTWRYTPAGDINVLAGGQVYTETFTAVVTDEHGAESEQTFTLTITGDNDAPVLSDAAAAGTDLSLYNGTVLSGRIPGSDIDMGDTVTYSYGGAVAERNGTAVSLADYGTLVLNGDGTWSFKAETPAQKDKILGLREDETLVITVSVTGTDNGGLTDGSTLAITIDGTNQAPVVDGGSCTLTDEDKLLEIGAGISGQITVRDADEGDGYTYALVGTKNGLYGALDLRPDGSWIYTPLAGLDLNFMSADKAYFDIFKVRITDDFGASVEEEICLRISGLNDAVVITGTSQGALDLNPFDGTALTGHILGFDPDEDGGIASVTIAGAVTVKLNGAAALLSTFGALQMALDGTWKLISNPLQLLNLAALGLNDLLTLTVPIEVLDNHGLATIDEIVIRLGGGNQPPVFDPNSLNQMVSEDVLMAAHTVSGALHAYDPDGQTLLYALPSGGTGAYGILSLNADGTWTYTLQRDINFMSAGQTYTESFQVRVSDGHGGQETKTLSINISGQNDAPVFVASSLASSATEDALLAAGTVSGTLAATDPDTGAVLAYSIKAGTGTGLYGNFTMTAGGQWTYTPTGNLNTLAAGQVLTETFTAVVSDGKGGIKEETFTLTITGENDAPVLQSGGASAVTELLAGGQAFSGQIVGFDIDAGDVITYTAAVPIASVNGTPVAASVYGDFVLGTNGQWSFTPTTPAQKDALAALGSGQILTLTVLITGKDKAGASAQSTLTLTVAGQDAAAPVSSVQYEDQVPGGGAGGALTVSGALSYALADPAASPFINISMDASGNYAYTFTPAGQAWFAALNVGGAPAHVPYTVNVTMPGGAVIQRVLDVEVRPTNAGNDSLYIASASDGLATHNPLDAAQSADPSASTYYLDRGDGLLQGNDTVSIASGVNNIKVYTYGGDDMISASGTRSGMYLDAGGGSNTVMIGSLLAASAGNTIKSAGGSVTVTSSYAVSGALYGMKASGGQQNLVEGVAAGGLINGGVTVNTNGGSGVAYGMHAVGGTNEVRAASVSVNTLGANAAGLYAGASGSNLVYGGTVTVNTTLQGSGAVYGLYASGSGANNTIRASSGPLSLTVRDDVSGGTPVGGSWSLYAAASGTNTVVGGSVAGTSDTISLDLGLNAAGGTNSITTGSGSDSLSLAGGMNVSGGGINTVNAGSGNDSLRLSGGMAAATGGKNTIDAGTGSDFVGIHGNVTANGTGSANLVTGSSVTGGGDTVSIYGNVSASGGGANSITTGTGNDLVNISGIVSGSGNTIATGAGNDTIRLDGSAAVGSLKVQAGTGNDTLVLVAQGVLDFDNNYLSWLKDMLNNTDHGIENIVVEGILDITLLTSLILFITTYNLTHPHIELGIAPYGFYAPHEPFMLRMAAFSGAETEEQVAAVLAEQSAVSGYASAALVEAGDENEPLLVAAAAPDLSGGCDGDLCAFDGGTAGEHGAFGPAPGVFAPLEESAGTAGRDTDFASLAALIEESDGGASGASFETATRLAGETGTLPDGDPDFRALPDEGGGTVDGVYDAFVDGLYTNTSPEPAPRMEEAVEPVSEAGENSFTDYVIADAVTPDQSLGEEADLLLLQSLAYVA